MQTVQARCPHCQNVLRIPAQWLDKPMRCKHCKNTFQARSKSVSVPIAAPAPQPKSASPSMAQPAMAGAVAGGVPPFTPTSGDPFGFDDAPAPESASIKRQRPGRGMHVLVLMFFILFALGASGAAFVVYKAVTTTPDSTRQTAHKGNGGKGENPPPGERNGSGDSDPTPPDTKVIPPKDKTKKDPPKKDTKKPFLSSDPFPRRALLISVNNYLMFNMVHYGSAQDLYKGGYPGSSTGVLRDRLTRPPMNFPASQVIELSDAVPRESKAAKAHPTQKSVIEMAIRDFVDSSREQDRVMLFFIGQATHLEDKKSYLIPISGNLNDPDSLIPLQWVYAQLASCKAQQKILVLDVFRYSPGRGGASTNGGEGDEGTMPEGFDKDVLNPPAGVQVWCACQKEQSSTELEQGSAFMQALCHSLQGGGETKGFSEPTQPIPIEGLVATVNKRLKDLVAVEKRTQISRLTGKAPAAVVAYNKAEPLPEPMKLKPPTLPKGNVAGYAQINKILDEMKVLPPYRESRSGERDLLKAENLPPFMATKLDAYKTDGYQNITELQKKYAAMKKAYLADKKEEKEAFDKEYPLRAAYFEMIDALHENSKLQMREVIRGPTIDPKQKAAILKEQEPLGISTFRLEQVLPLVREAAKNRDKETSLRWRANFDFAQARYLSRMVYLIEYNYALGRIRADALPDLAPGQNGWRIGTGRKIAVTEKKAKDYVKEIKSIWTRVQTEHPGTPWELLAQRERESALGVQWRAKSD